MTYEKVRAKTNSNLCHQKYVSGKNPQKEWMYIGSGKNTVKSISSNITNAILNQIIRYRRTVGGAKAYEALTIVWGVRNPVMEKHALKQQNFSKNSEKYHFFFNLNLYIPRKPKIWSKFEKNAKNGNTKGKISAFSAGLA